MINDIRDIDTETESGKLALLLLAHITTTTHQNKTPYETLEELNAQYYNGMYVEHSDD